MTKHEIAVELRRVADEMIALSMEMRAHDWSHASELAQDADAMHMLGEQIKIEAGGVS